MMPSDRYKRNDVIPGYQPPPGHGTGPEARSAVADYLVGMFGVFGLQVVGTVFAIWIFTSVLENGAGLQLLLLLELGYMVIVPVCFKRAGLRYIARGYVTAVALIFLVVGLLFGACFFALGDSLH